MKNLFLFRTIFSKLASVRWNVPEAQIEGQQIFLTRMSLNIEKEEKKSKISTIHLACGACGFCGALVMGDTLKVWPFPLFFPCVFSVLSNQWNWTLEIVPYKTLTLFAFHLNLSHQDLSV